MDEATGKRYSINEDTEETDWVDTVVKRSGGDGGGGGGGEGISC